MRQRVDRRMAELHLTAGGKSHIIMLLSNYLVAPSRMRLILVYLHGNHIVTFFSPGDYASYGAVLAVTKSELKEFETMTHITISRFFRDGPVWQYLLSTVNSHQFSSIRINSHQISSDFV